MSRLVRALFIAAGAILRCLLQSGKKSRPKCERERGATSEQGRVFFFMAKVSGLEVAAVDVTRTKYREQTCNG